jgi:prepilin peptidase CpaA
MISASTLSYLVLATAVIVLLYAAIIDLRKFEIPNECIIILVCLFAAYAWLTGQWTTQLPWNLAFAAFMLFVLLFFYMKNWLGGGDVKILAVAFLWVGIHFSLIFAILLAIFASGHLVGAKLGWLRVQELNGGKRIPFAPSVAVALIVTLALAARVPL